MKQKLFLVFLFLIVTGSFIFTGFFHCKRTAKEDQSQSFTIAKAWWPAWDTFQVGVKQREQAAKLFQTTFLQTEDYTYALNDFQTDKVDAATLTIYEAILAAAKGIPLKIVLLLDYTTGSDGVIAKKNIFSILDLKGKRIGVEKGTIAHFTLLKALEKAGLDQSDIQLVNFNLETLRQAFLNDEVDAVSTYEPYMPELINQGNGHVIFSSREIPRAICDVLFVKESIVRDFPGAVRHWINAWDDALNFRGSESEEYLSTLSNLNGTPIPDLKRSLTGIFFTNLAENRIAFGTQDNPGYLLESLREMEDFMYEQGIIQQHLPLQDLIEFECIQEFFNL